MVEENEARLPEDQAEKLAEGQPVEESSPAAELPARQDENEGQLDASDYEEAPLEEAPAAGAVDEAMPSEMDQTQADHEAEVEARLGEGELIEDVPPMEPERVADLVPEQLEEKAVEAETKRRKDKTNLAKGIIRGRIY